MNSINRLLAHWPMKSTRRLVQLCVLMCLLLSQAACMTIKSEQIIANAEPMSRLDEVSRVYLVKQGWDEEIERLVRAQLAEYGYEVLPDEKKDQAEMLVYYEINRDFHVTGTAFYIIPVGHEFISKVRLVFREPKTGYALASGNFSQRCTTPLKENRNAEEIINWIFSEVMLSYEKHR